MWKNNKIDLNWTEVYIETYFILTEQPSLSKALAIEGVLLQYTFDVSLFIIRPNFCIIIQESVYLDEEDRKAEGYAGMVSANMNGLQSIKAVISTFLHHPVFGEHIFAKTGQ